MPILAELASVPPGDIRGRDVREALEVPARADDWSVDPFGAEISEGRLLPVVLAIRDFLALFEHVFFGLLVGNTGRRRGLPAILGVGLLAGLCYREFARATARW